MSVKRTLTIVRHAKSSWDIAGISDIDRPLKLRGIRDAYEMARRLKIERRIPELILTSPANRAMHTASIFNRVFEKKYAQVLITEQLYETGTATILKLIGRQNAAIKKIMIVGHNPDFSDLASKLLQKNKYVDLPTCGVCHIEFKAETWCDIENQNPVSEIVDFPKKNSLVNLE